MAGEHKLRILHVSDLHERVALEFMSAERKAKVRLGHSGRRRVLDESNFFDVIHDETRQSGKVDLICFTGDVADWGLPEEYAAASGRIEKILEALGVPPERLFPIPGNHDVQRLVEKETWSEIRRLAAANPDGLSDWMAGLDPPYGVKSAWRELITNRTAAFWKWVESDLDQPSLMPSRSPHGRLGYQAKIEGLDLPFEVHIFGLDSAWLAGDDHDAGKLRLSPAQIKLLCRDAAGRRFPGFRLALLHHPLTDLADGRRSYELLSEVADLVLHGHQHDPVFEIKADPDRSLRVLTAGSLYEGDQGDLWINGFNIVDAFLDDNGRPMRYQVRFWSWSDRGHWHRSSAIYRKAVDGILELPVADAEHPAAPGAPAAPAEDSGPDAPWYFVPRPEHHEEVRKRLLPQNGRAPVAAIVGMASTGKSTLAAEVARDPAILSAYPDGLLWATLGSEEPPILEHLQRLIATCGSSPLAATDIREAQSLLSKAMARRKYLLVVDDVWRFQDVEPFLKLASGCALLLTTREWAVAEAADASIYELPALSHEQAMALIERRLRRTLSPPEADQAGKVADSVGCLPLSLLLASARIEEGDTWTRLAADLDDEQKRLYALEPPELEPEPARAAIGRSLVAAFNLSARGLTEHDREAFARLSLVAEDVPFNSEIAGTLWNPSAEAAEPVLRRLHRKSLVLFKGVRDGRRAYQLHDEQRNAARRLLGLTAKEAHALLLEIYRARAAANQWSAVPDDGYIGDHLFYHLSGAGRGHEIHDVLREEKQSKNAWFQARQSNIDGFLRDLDVAMNAADQTPELQARYSAMRSSIATIGDNVPISVVEELVRHRKWPPSRAFGWAVSQPAARRFSRTTELAAILEEPWRRRSISAAFRDLVEAPEDTQYGNAWMF
jgi:3',5'-cyclic AMP phosphodiesterase CpdA